ncbi:MAG: uL15 family ribosomal protein [Candidatus Woesearchaeota archaeon]|jgi:large subunit ribosomal protein L15|nr:50S ribosomal protein L15 [archaeon]MDP6548248.1 uL15 family ribosomal protein [Candidatus Woesearchaeota archaeon]MDP7263222.1 uL15 family ribosomal protein [Candidatus Woesearchaeota archaeon]MDP7623009.1 uL15 family ribosomal protein [Candidatus Woesearchaeota archaeon]HJN56637.1 uL15 family ribosomal protein [Candidatus Woesearchaeota archaeon]|tara:strand:- start:8169 stop:8618 length:450 start_codon:yes stop_codon:yes gene_type:complete
MINKRKKNVRQRGSMTHGWGSKKKHRGAGNRGGKGLAGTGKRSDNKKPSIWNNKYFGKYGFKSKSRKNIVATNILYLEQNLPALNSEKLISKENDFYSVDLEKIGFNKLLSKGKISNKYRIKVPYASKKAIEKIKKGGGEVILPKQDKE